MTGLIDPKQLGRAIARRRAGMGWDHAMLATRIGGDERRMACVEAGLVELSVTDLARLGVVFGVPPSVLLAEGEL